MDICAFIILFFLLFAIMKRLKNSFQKVNRIYRIDAKAEAPIVWPRDAMSRLICKDPDAGIDWGQKERGGDRGWDGWMASLTQWTWV